MRQKLPVSHGYELLVNDLGRTVGLGEEFDAPLLVPGCVPVEDAAGEDDKDADSTAETAPPGEPQKNVGAAEAPPEPDKPRAKGTRP